MNMWFWQEGTGWWMMFGGIWMLLFWGGLIVLIIWGIKKLTGRAGSGLSSSEKQSPLDIAKERYASGAISKEEFEEIQKRLA